MEILQARILQWVAMFRSRGSSQPRDQTQVSHFAGEFFTLWVTREALFHVIFPTQGSRLCLLHWQVDYLPLSHLGSPIYMCIFVVVQLLSCVWFFVTLWTAAHQASLSFTISRSLLKLISIESVMPSNHLVFCCPLLLLSSVFPSIRVFFQWVGSSHQVATILELQLQHQSFQWIFSIDFL